MPLLVVVCNPVRFCNTKPEIDELMVYSVCLTRTNILDLGSLFSPDRVEIDSKVNLCVIPSARTISSKSSAYALSRLPRQVLPERPWKTMSPYANSGLRSCLKSIRFIRFGHSPHLCQSHTQSGPAARVSQSSQPRSKTRPLFGTCQKRHAMWRFNSHT